MFEKEEISFSKFYLCEFYDAVDQNAKLRFADKQYTAFFRLALPLTAYQVAFYASPYIVAVL